MGAIDSLQVAIVGMAPACTVGLATTCARRGLTVAEPRDVYAWLHGRNRALIVGFDGADGAAHDLLQAARRDAVDAVTVALLGDDTPRGYHDALSEGATTALPQTVEPDAVVDAVVRAADGYVTVPIAVMSDLLAHPRQVRESAVDELKGADIEILRLLAEGATVSTLARFQRVAERTMYRRLDQLFRRMEVDTRVGAVARAVHWGVIQV